ncbi:MAG: NAD(P)/FAD-dependent oxidoreductase [Leptospirales bacterium]|nr:NAD(P)/FAD-dependent oxidoreductase [Leptospirales bacterium]
MKNVVVIGAGTGGLVAANRLKAGLGKRAHITIFEKTHSHAFPPSLLWLAVGKRRPAQITRRHKRRRGIEMVNASVTKIDWSNRVVQTADRSVPYDYLILAPGAAHYPERLPGFSEAALDLYSAEGATRISAELAAFTGGKIVILVASLPFKCPAAPYEAAFLVDARLQERNIDAQIQIITPEPMPMPSAGPEIGKSVEQMLLSRNIEYLPSQNAVSINASSQKIKMQNGEELSYDLLIGIPPHGLPSFLSGSQVLAENGWVKVNPQTLETSVADVFAIGDVTTIGLRNGKPLPKAGVFAHAEAETASAMVIGRIKGKESSNRFDGHGACFLETGYGRAGHATGDFFAESGPKVFMKTPSRFSHLVKVVFEKWWLWKWF